jgi:ComF family protein
MRAEHGGIGAVWKARMSGILDLIFPPASLEGGAQPQTTGLGAEAWGRVRFLENPVCDGCGAPFDYDRGPGVRCIACEAEPRAFARARAACLYDDASRDLILQYKHADHTELAVLFSKWVGRAAADLIEDADAVVPVPLHPIRLLNRRYNQAAEIARPLARRHGLTYLPDALVRTRAGTQGGKSRAGRRRAVAGAFVVPAPRAGRVAGKRILLVDDVLTTGATAEGCAKALLKAGAASVDLAVVARVREASDLSI